MIVLGVAALFGDPESLVGPESATGVVLGALFLWVFLEAGFLSVWGATPGKAVLHLAVRRADGLTLSYFAAFRRSLSVWVRGLGFGLPVVSFITLAVAYRSITRHGTTSWDRKIAPTIATGPLQRANFAGAVTLTVLCLVAFAVLQGLAPSRAGMVGRDNGSQPGAAQGSITGLWSGRDAVRMYRFVLDESTQGTITGLAHYVDGSGEAVVRSVSGIRQSRNVALEVQQPQHTDWTIRGEFVSPTLITGWWYIGTSREIAVALVRE